jgi:hypothetical protein
MSDSRIIDEVAFSDLLQHPRRTTARLDGHRALRLRRRDAEDLILMSADRVDSEALVLETTARLLTELIRDDVTRDALIRVLPRVLPWMHFLPEDSAVEMTNELIAVCAGASALRNIAPVAVTLSAWQHTAEIYADPELLSALRHEHPAEDDFGPVPYPVEDE